MSGILLLVLSDLLGHSSVLPSIGGGGPSFLSPLFPTSLEDSDGDLSILVTGKITGTIEERLVSGKVEY